MKYIKWILATSLLFVPLLICTIVAFLSAWLSWHIEDVLMFIEDKATLLRDHMIKLRIKVAPWPWD